MCTSAALEIRLASRCFAGHLKKTRVRARARIRTTLNDWNRLRVGCGDATSINYVQNKIDNGLKNLGISCFDVGYATG